MSLRMIATALTSACALAAVPGPVRAWNAGTHQYVAERLLGSQASDPRLILEAGYGANVLDLFNSDFTSPGLELQVLLHDPASSPFMDVWNLAATQAPIQRAFAYGLVSHNNTWGADATAHLVDISGGQGPGWTYAKSEELAPWLEAALPPGLPIPHEVLVEMGHILVEQAVDLLMLQVDPALGEKVMASAAARIPSDPAMLQVAWSGTFAVLTGGIAASTRIIREVELGSRESLYAYGWALSQPDALELLSGQIAVLATDYLAFLGLPPVPAEDLAPLVAYGILVGEGLCAQDFYPEVEGTVAWVAANMAAHGVTY